MEKATDQINISREARLSVELRIKEANTKASEKTSPQSDMSLSTTQTIVIPLRQKDVPIIQNPQSESPYRISSSKLTVQFKHHHNQMNPKMTSYSNIKII